MGMLLFFFPFVEVKCLSLGGRHNFLEGAWMRDSDGKDMTVE